MAKRKIGPPLEGEINEELSSKDKFAGVLPGTLVRRSKHWYHAHPGAVKGQLGMVIGHNVYEEGGRLVTYPLIQWEEQTAPSGTHPATADVAPSAFRQAFVRR